MQIIKIDPLPTGQLDVKMIDPDNSGWNRKLARSYEDLRDENERFRAALEEIAQINEGVPVEEWIRCREIVEKALK